MIDIHCHILPGLDDGAQSMEEALRMCEIALADGIKTVVATPHHLNGTFNNPKEKIIGAVSGLNEALRERAIGLEVLPGADNRADVSLPGELAGGRALTINGNMKYTLLEFPSFFVPEHAMLRVFELRIKGFTPVITHPERNDTFMGNLDLLRAMIRDDSLVQITAASLSGGFGSGPQKAALRMLELDMVHLVASDAHNTSLRPPVLSEAFEVISREKGADEARRIFHANPEAVIKGEMPGLREPLRPKKASLFSFFTRRSR